LKCEDSSTVQPLAKRPPSECHVITDGPQFSVDLECKKSLSDLESNIKLNNLNKLEMYNVDQMKIIIKFLFGILLLLAVSFLAANFYLPLKPEVLKFEFDPKSVSGDLDKYLKKSEEKIPGLLPDVHKRIIWAHSEKNITPISIVYIHGFSSTSEEIRPLPDLIAEHFNANLYFTRLAGHGQASGKLLKISASDWIYDVQEALTIGKRIGQKTIVICTSTGGTLIASTLANKNLDYSADAVVLISPNFEMQSFWAPFMTLPLSYHWAPKLFGQTQVFKPLSRLHEKYWSLIQPTTNIIELAYLVKFANGIKFEDINMPALFYYSDEDKVVNSKETQEVAQKWGGKTESIIVKLSKSDDPNIHVVVGKIRSPNQTDFAIKSVIKWINSLKL